MLKVKFGALVCAIGLQVIAAAAMAQQPGQPALRPQPGQQRDNLRARQAGPAGELTGKDLALALCLAIDNQKEVQIAEFAAGKAETPEVKQFAQKMVEDHGQMLAKLHQLTGGKSQAVTQELGASGAAIRRQTDAAPPGRDDQPRRRIAEANDQLNPAEQPGERQPRQQRRQSADSGQAIDFVALKAEVAQECIKTARQELGSKEGKEFDQCYMFGQVMAHMALKDALTVFERHASPELQRVIAEAEKTTQTHLAHAKQISEKLDSDPASGRQLRGLRGDTTPDETRPREIKPGDKTPGDTTPPQRPNQ